MAATCSGEAEFPLRGARGGWRGGPVRFGRRGGSRVDQTVPRQVGQVRHHHTRRRAVRSPGSAGGERQLRRWCAAGRRHNRRTAETTRMVSSGRRCRARRPARCRVGAPENPTGDVRVGLERLDQRSDPLDDRSVRARDHDVIDVAEPGVVEYPIDGACGSAPRSGSAPNRSSHCSPVTSSGGAPAVEELGGDDVVARIVGDRGPSPNSSAAAPSPPSRSSAEPGRPTRTSARHRQAARWRGGPPRGESAAARAAQVGRERRVRQPERGVNRRRVGLVRVRGAAGREVEVGGQRVSRRAATAAAATAIVVLSSS